MSSQLPVELLQHTLRFLPLRERIKCGRVCKTWRQAIDDDAVAWKTIELLNEDSALEAILKTYKERSDSHANVIKDLVVPIHISKEQYQAFSEAKLQLDIQYLQVDARLYVVDEIWADWAHNLRHVDINTKRAGLWYHEATSLNLSLEELFQQAPNLEICSLTSIHLRGQTIAQVGTYNLKELRLNRVFVPTDRANIIISDITDTYPQLKILEISDTKAPRLLRSIENSTSLQELYMVVEDASYGAGQKFAPPILPNLKVLDLTSPHIPRGLHIFFPKEPYIAPTYPKLEVFRYKYLDLAVLVQGEGTGLCGDRPAEFPIIGANSPLLKELEIDHSTWIRPDILYNTMETWSHLESLIIKGCDYEFHPIGMEILEEICLNLQKLEFDTYSPKLEKPLKSFLASRRKITPPPFTKLVVVIPETKLKKDEAAKAGKEETDKGKTAASNLKEKKKILASVKRLQKFAPEVDIEVIDMDKEKEKMQPQLMVWRYER